MIALITNCQLLPLLKSIGLDVLIAAILLTLGMMALMLVVLATHPPKSDEINDGSWLDIDVDSKD